MNKAIVIFLLSVVVCAQAWAIDEFAGIKCGGDVVKAMVGKHASNERVVVLEKRHSDLGLKDLGGTEISDRLFVVQWRVCGNEYVELRNTEKNVVRDVLPVPGDSLRSPRSIGQCKIGPKDIPETVIAVLDNSAGHKPKNYLEEIVLPAKIAWKLDEHQERFVAIPAEGLSCSVSGLSDR
jgi:hypothetical protein